MSSDLTPSKQGADKPADTVVSKQSEALRARGTFVRFRNRTMALKLQPYPHYVPLTRELFDQLAYPVLGGQTRSRMGDIMSYLGNTSLDLTALEHTILFGSDAPDADPSSAPLVWDTRACQWDTSLSPQNCVWRSPHPPLTDQLLHPTRIAFILQLAGGDEALYDDIMQSMAPIIMDRKPDGAIWWVGDGANGKSTLMDAIYRLFPGQLASINVKRLTDGRDTPSLNGTLANVVKESSEGRVDDTEIYKNIGTHEDFRVHKFHSQEDVTIRGNLHHIFSANSIPVFNDKGHSARRRTFIIPFNQRFQSDPTFEERTFTPEFFAHLVAELARYAAQLKRQGYKYKFSATTLGAKETYDNAANNTEEYAREIIEQGVVGFDSFGPVRTDYENWCRDMGYVPLGIGNMRQALQNAGFERQSIRLPAGHVVKRYRLRSVEVKDLVPFNAGRPGLFSVEGFTPAEPPAVPEFDKQREQDLAQVNKSILNGKW